VTNEQGENLTAGQTRSSIAVSRRVSMSLALDRLAPVAVVIDQEMMKVYAF
jgi:hypothetical protein